ncbi:hypothetical protein GCM10020220_095160 [Nonomuraea rubra]
MADPLHGPSTIGGLFHWPPRRHSTERLAGRGYDLYRSLKPVEPARRQPSGTSCLPVGNRNEPRN